MSGGLETPAGENGDWLRIRFSLGERHGFTCGACPRFHLTDKLRIG